MLKQSLPSLRCPQGGPSPVPPNPWGGNELGTSHQNTQGHRAAILEICAVLAPHLFPAASHRSRTFLPLLVIILINN